MGQIMYMRKGEVHTAPSNFPPVGTALNDMTWEQIRVVSDAGLASSYFSVGDTKNIIINGKVGATTFTNLSIDVFIIGIDHNSGREGTNKIHFQIGKINGVPVCLCDSYYNSNNGNNYSVDSGAFVMNTTKTNYYGWANSHMRKTVLGSDSTPTSPRSNTLLAALPADLRVVMKPITKYTDNFGCASSAIGGQGGGHVASNVTATTDYLPLLAEFEVQGKHSCANSTEQNSQAQYAYYKAGNSTAKYKHNATNTAASWSLRSVSADYSENFCIYSMGFFTTGYANFAYGVSPCFAV